jgi:integrase/recombinase XerD
MSATAVNDVARLRVREGERDGIAILGTDWPVFWGQLCSRLRQDGYRPNTLRVYRQVLRDLRAFLRDRHGIVRPGGLSVETAKGFLAFLGQKNVSWSWMSSTISVLRTAFDKLGGMAVTRRMVTPRRKWPLPETLSERELRLLLDALPNPRDRLLVGLLAGCGLRVSEACRIRWADFDRAGALRLDDPSGLRSRTVTVPQGLLPLFQGLAAVSRRSDPMICGRRTSATAPRPLSARQVERLIKAAAQRAGILKRVSPMVLRHSYALRRLMAGDNIRAVQEALGHHSIKTTLRYQACVPPKAASPADPEPPEVALKQLAQVLDRLSTLADTVPQAAFAQGP